MKFETHVHYLLDAIRKNKLQAGLTHEGGKAWVNWITASLPRLEQTPVFVLRDDPDILAEQSMADIAADWQAERRLIMPYPEGMFLEMRAIFEQENGEPPFEEIWIVHAQLVNDYDPAKTDMPEKEFIRTLLFRAMAENLHVWEVMPRIVMAFPGHRHTMICPSFEGLTYPDKENPPENVQIIHSNVEYAHTVFAGVLVMMESPAIEMSMVAVPRKINRDRRIMKRSPVPNHTILRLPRVAYVSQGDGTRSHKRPKMHWRRPHQREYKPGLFTDIPLTLVAKKPDQPEPPPPVVEIVTR